MPIRESKKQPGPSALFFRPFFQVLNAAGHKYDRHPGSFKKKKGLDAVFGKFKHGSFQN